MKKAEREEYLKNKLVEMQVYESELRENGIVYIGGVDEVGRGPLAGPVCAACVVLPEDFDILGVDDSKKLSEKKRNELYVGIVDSAICWGVGLVDNRRIDEINILNATKEAMLEAIRAANERLTAASPGSARGEDSHANESAGQIPQIEHLLIDAVKLPESGIHGTAIIKGDSKSLSIAAASIVAKVTRDRIMIEMDSIYPGYGFASNKGYGTKAHYEGLKAFGKTPIHRLTFL